MKHSKPTIKCNVSGLFTVSFKRIVFTVGTLEEAIEKALKLVCPVIVEKVSTALKVTFTKNTTKHFLSGYSYLSRSNLKSCKEPLKGFTALRGDTLRNTL